MPIIEVNHLTKEFKLGQLRSLRHSLGSALARLRGAAPPARPRFKALDDIHFQVEEGDVLGIVGTNGAGKSTLLKILSRITVPTSGSMVVRGRISPLIEVGSGLIGDLTGRENVYLNGIILGMSYRQIRRKLDEIVAFAELEEFIDTPIKRYSSGMQIRLGFSIATAVDADILIVDEVLAVGDLAFQRKCFDRIESMIKQQGRTILLVSHNIRQVERLCTRGLLLDHGHIVADGEPPEICRLFYERSDAKIRESSRSGARRWANTQTSDDLEVLDVALVDHQGRPTNTLAYKGDVDVVVSFRVAARLRNPTFNVGVHTTDFLYLTTHASTHELEMRNLEPGTYRMTCRIARNPLLPGVYGLRLGITEGLAARTVFYGENLVHFQVAAAANALHSGMERTGFFALEAEWSRPQAVTQPDVEQEAVR
jgi:ABC-type polysaccharide/polyol phosphate transport system ATPase subunit